MHKFLWTTNVNGRKIEYPAELGAEAKSGTANIIGEEGLGEGGVGHVVINAIINIVALTRSTL